MGSRIFAADVGAPEGPVTLPDGSMYVTEMSHDTLNVTKLTPTGSRQVVKKTGGRPNGLAIDGEGLIWVAEAGLRALVCIEPDGREVKRLEGDDKHGRFYFPNDLAFGPDGLLYMTDSGMALADFLDGENIVEGFMDLAWDGRVYAINPKSTKIERLVDSRIRFTNGIAFDADDALYANASFTGEVYRYDVFGSKTAVREVFGNVLQEDDQKGFKGPDGMKFGVDGRLYCTVYGQQNVTVLDRDGRVADRMMLDGPCPTNLAFSRDGNKILVTEVAKGQVEILEAPCAGQALHYPITR
ncbi:SMP-30/gluconolactonase/LRE family protein [Mesorhizobium abyssinicae]|uniref:SMP-30/gluconolactonase/LRE family protein n=1 Tax=Mesorhizobium abyssinicae TaxID=1209958 RepID=UPI002A242CBD|nr:SMP-30/gluconolactonase/LRE family protein [Mesorhizobium abyssinicae]MDX8434361.1 SMP-30/gluconolactonase/LRE family protein [Mesorhizobium abyssinicae]